MSIIGLFIKGVNWLKSWLGYVVSLLVKKPVVWGYPPHLSIEVSAVCNLHCPDCDRGLGLVNRNGLMNEQVYNHIDDLFFEKALTVQLFFQGEPMLHPQLTDFIRRARKKGVLPIISTNGHFLTETRCAELVESGLFKLIVSLDGFTQSVYETYRKGGSVTQVIDGLHRLAAVKRTSNKWFPLVEVQFLVFSHNQHELPLVRNLARQLGFSFVAKSAQLVRSSDINRLPDLKKYSRYTVKNNRLELKKNLPNRCRRIWSTAVFTLSGQWVPCCYDKQAQHLVGSVDEGVKTWKNARFTDFRKQVIQHRNKMEICRNCAEN